MILDLKKIPFYWYIIFGILLVQVTVFMIFGQDVYIGIHDNLDNHIVHYQIMALSDGFFKGNIPLPILDGLGRDFFATQLSLYALLYYLLPNYVAYMAGYFIKIVMAVVAGMLLGKDILGDRWNKYKGLVVMISFIYGLLPMYPAFCFSLSSIPFIVFLIRHISTKPKIVHYVLIFLYPSISYFTFFGMFILAYLCIYFIIIWIIKRRIPIYILLAIIVLSIGYSVFEYRLFGIMLFDNTPTIRDTMVMGSYTWDVIIKNAYDGFINSFFHVPSLHKYTVLPLALIYFIYTSIGGLRGYLQSKRSVESTDNNIEKHSILDGVKFDIRFFIIMLIIIMNSLIYSLFNYEPIRNLMGVIVPPLKGWNYSRTIFFNPFLWYVVLFIILKAIIDFNWKYSKLVAGVIITISLVNVMGSQTLYNDFYNTIRVHGYEHIRGVEAQDLSYRDFYSRDLIEEIKKDIDYNGELSVAYGMHPAVIQYSGIATLDGCVSYYYQSYKEEFRRIIEPALAKSKVAREYYDEWGARAYIFSGTDESIWLPSKTIKYTDDKLYIDTEAFKKLGGRYIFSRIKISNDDDLGLVYIGEYSKDPSPYTIYLYRCD